MEGRRVVDDDRAVVALRDLLGPLEREVAGDREEDDVAGARGLERELLDLLVAERGLDVLARGARRREELELGHGEVALAENVDDLDADRAGHADDTNLEGLVSAQHVKRLLIRSPVDLAKQRRGRHRLASHRGRRLRASAEGERAATQAAQSKHDGAAHGLLISVAL